MQMKRWFPIAARLVTLALLLAGCAPAAAPAVPTTPASPAQESKPAAAPTPTPKVEGQPRYGGILDRSHYEDLMWFDIQQESTLKGHLSLANCYSGLLKFDNVEIDRVVGDLAETWEASQEGAVWTFNLRKGVKWHDGKPFTAEDARYSLERMAFWKEYKIVSPRAGALLSAVKAVDAPNENTVRVTLKYPSASFITNVTSGWVLMLPKHIIEAKGDMKKDVVGTGPFKFKSFVPGVAVEVVKNQDYFLKGRPYLDGIRVFTLKDDATRVSAFRTGRIKMTGTGSKGLTHSEAQTVRKEMGDKAVIRTYPAYMRLILLSRLTRAPWDDIRVRKAIDLAFDRQAAIKLNFNVGSLGAAMDPKGMWGIPEEEMKLRPGYRQPKTDDIAEAKRLMAEAGYPKGFKTSMLTRSGASDERLGVVVKDQLAVLGIEAQLEPKERGALEELYQRRAFEISPMLTSDPMDDPDVSFGQNYVSSGSRNYGDFKDQLVDDLFEKQARTLDSAERKRIARQMQERVLELAPYPVIYYDVYNMGHWQEVMGYKLGSTYTHNSLFDVWLAK